MEAKKNFFKNNSTLFLAISSLFSQIVGFIRDKLLSHIYGASLFLDSYYAAFRVPEFMYLSVGSFVSSAIMVPLFSKRLYDEDKTIWFQKLLTTFILFFIFIYGIILIFLPKIINNLYKYSPTNFKNEVIIYATILLFSTFFLSLSSIITSVSQERRNFFATGFAPILYNIGAVIGILILRPFWGITGVCIGVVLGSIMHLAVSLPFAINLGLFKGYLRFIYKAFSLNILKEILGKSFLRTLSLFASAVSFFLLAYFGSLYPAGAITIISLAFTLQTVFHTILGVSYTTTIFPKLTNAFVKKQEEIFDNIFGDAFKKIFLISIIFTATVMIFRYEIVYILFGSGKFINSSVILTASALGIFITSLYAQNTILLISRASYAKGDYFLPLITNSVSAILMYVFGNIFYHKFGSGINSVLFVALAYSLSQYFALFVSFFVYRKNKKILTPYLKLAYILKIILAVFLVSVLVRQILYFLLLNKTSILSHIIFSGLVFVFFIGVLYLILGFLNDKNINEDLDFLKNISRKYLFAFLPNRR